MKKEHLISAVFGGVVAGAAFGAGFFVAQRGIAKLGKKEKEGAISTRPMEMPLVVEETSSLIGDVKPTYSNAGGFELRRSGKLYKCFNPQGQQVSNAYCLQGGLQGGAGVNRFAKIKKG